MKWIDLGIIIFCASVIAILEILKKCIPLSRKRRRFWEVVIIVIGLLGLVYTKIRETQEMPSEIQVEEAKAIDREATANLVVAKLQNQFPDVFSNPEKTSEQKQYVIKGFERAKSNDPNSALSELIRQEKEVCSRVDKDIDSLIQINKEIAIFAQSQGKIEVALNALNKILKYAPEDGFAFRERGFINLRLGNIEQAEEDLVKSIEASKTNIEKASAWISTGFFYSIMGQYQKSEGNFKSAYKVGKEIPNSTIIAVSCLNLSALYMETNNAGDAELCISEAITEFEKSKEEKGLAYAQFNLAMLYLNSGEIYEAKKRIGSLIQIAEDTNDEIFKSAIFLNLGNFYATTGDYTAAKEYILKSMQIDKELQLEGMLASDYGNLGLIYKNQGDFIKAEEAYNKALVLHKKFSDLPGTCRTLINLGNLFVERKEYDKAERFFDEAMEIATKLKHNLYTATCLASIGVMNMDKENFIEAESKLNRALSLFEEGNFMYEKGCALFNLASIRKELGDNQNAISTWNESKKIFERIGLPHMVARVEYELDKLNRADSNDINEPSPILFGEIRTCRIQGGLRFTAITNEPMAPKMDEKTSYIRFGESEEVSVYDFVERVRLYYEKNPPDSEEGLEWGDIKDNKVIVKRYRIFIVFPQRTMLRPTEGGRLLIQEAEGEFEIRKEI